jgi:hypothetical protein
MALQLKMLLGLQARPTAVQYHSFLYRLETLGKEAQHLVVVLLLYLVPETSAPRMQLQQALAQELHYRLTQCQGIGALGIRALELLLLQH